jgi:hypothetical protein
MRPRCSGTCRSTALILLHELDHVFGKQHQNTGDDPRKFNEYVFVDPLPDGEGDVSIGEITDWGVDPDGGIDDYGQYDDGSHDGPYADYDFSEYAYQS